MMTTSKKCSPGFVIALFFISGFCALIYELLWFRKLGFIFGNTVYAATTVLTAYMTGLALGAHVMGKWAAAFKNRILAFGFFELAIGVWGLAMPFLFEGIRGIYRWTFLNVSDSFLLLTCLRFGLSFLAMLIPTMLMGGTLPLLSQTLAGSFEGFSKKLGWLYGFNTLGAVCGVLGAGFFFIPWLGLNGTNGLAIAGNGLVACVAFWAATRQGWREETAKIELAIDAVPVEKAWIFWMATGLSGFIALALEVVWFRALVLVFGSTTYSFSAMLAVFLFGIALGSLSLGWVVDKIKRHLVFLACLEVGIGAYTLLSMYAFNSQPEFLLHFLIKYGFQWSSMVTAQFLIAFFFLFIPTVLMGIAFMVITAAVRHHYAASSKAVGTAYAYNTIGCVVGSLSGGFLLLPTLGIERSLIALAFVAVGLGILLALLAKDSFRYRGLIVALGSIFILLGSVNPPAWSKKLMSAGAHFSPWNYVENGKVTLRDKLSDEQLLFYKEGVTATVSVGKLLDGSIFYSSGGKVEADSSPRSMMLQRLMGHLPMLFHPNPQRVLNIGLGAGVTLGALCCHPISDITVAEIESGALEVARIFAPYNHGAITNDKVKVVIGDGRNYLFCAPLKFDVITSDPFEPVHAGANHLYTVDHFQQAKKNLNDGGIMCQYIPLYELAPHDYLMILRSFIRVFPASVLFYTGEDTIVLGFKDGVVLQPKTVRENFKISRVEQSLQELGFVSPETILSMFVADLQHTKDWIGDGKLNTDNYPYVEYSAPKSALLYTTFANHRVLLDHFTPFPEAFQEAVSDEDLQRLEKTREGLKHVLSANIYRYSGHMTNTLEQLLKANELAPDNPVIKNELLSVVVPSANGLMLEGDINGAANGFQFALSLRPNEFWSLYHLIELSMKTGNTDYAKQLVEQAFRYYPDSALFLALRGKYKATFGDKSGAYEDFAKALAAMPWNAKLWEDYRLIAGFLGDNATAQRAGEQAEKIKKDKNSYKKEHLRVDT